MGKKGVLRVNFDGKLKLGIHEMMISSDAGLLVYWELNETFALTAGLNDMIDDHFPMKQLIQDINILESPAHGHQEGLAYNGSFSRACYHCEISEYYEEKDRFLKGNEFHEISSKRKISFFRKQECSGLRK